MANNIVLYPSPGMGHLVSMVELGKFILSHHPDHNITILTVTPPYNTGATAAYIKSVTSDTTSLTFHSLPTVTLPNDLDSYAATEAFTYDLLRLSIPHVREYLESISNISAFIIDFFCSDVLPVAAGELKIPTYFFFTSGANCLAAFMYFPTLHRSMTKSFKDTHEPVDVPGLPPIPPTDMNKPMLDRTTPEYRYFLETAEMFPKSSGIITNTFSSLENRVLQAISQGKCITDGPAPPLFCVGPLIMKSDRGESGAGDRHTCLDWLDKQPEKSVVFLCFGSLGVFSPEQIKEIAIGLERSEQRFIWVIRSPPEKGRNRYLPPPEPVLETLLPKGFLEKTRDRGLVVKSWAPQVEVLNHGSVGGFVMHCGWNSVLEAVCAGVPMVGWPLYAEQRENKVYLVEGLEMALPMMEEDGGFVTAQEVEKRVRELMDGGGKLKREKIQGMKEEARLAMAEGGSSLLDLGRLVDSWEQKL